MLEDEKNQRPVKHVGIEELEKKCRDSKEKNRQLILDKQDLQKELEEISEKFNTQSREWKNAIKQRDVALHDFEETNSELVETKAILASCEQNLKEKDALSRQLQEKCDIYKSELRAALACIFFSSLFFYFLNLSSCRSGCKISTFNKRIGK